MDDLGAFVLGLAGVSGYGVCRFGGCGFEPLVVCVGACGVGSGTGGSVGGLGGCVSVLGVRGSVQRWGVYMGA